MSEDNKKAKTYNSGYSLVVTHLTTNPPVRCLNRAERTGSLVFNVLWSYVKEYYNKIIYIVYYTRPNQARNLSFGEIRLLCSYGTLCVLYDTCLWIRHQFSNTLLVLLLEYRQPSHLYYISAVIRSAP